MYNASVGWYDGRNKCRVAVDKGDMEAAYGRELREVRVEVMESMIVLTDPREAAWRYRDE